MREIWNETVEIHQSYLGNISYNNRSCRLPFHDYIIRSIVSGSFGPQVLPYFRVLSDIWHKHGCWVNASCMHLLKYAIVLHQHQRWKAIETPKHSHIFGSHRARRPGNLRLVPPHCCRGQTTYSNYYIIDWKLSTGVGDKCQSGIIEVARFLHHGAIYLKGLSHRIRWNIDSQAFLSQIPQ